MKILVTGGAGYIGMHMVDMLIQHGHQVVVLDKHPLRINSFTDKNSVEYIVSDIANIAVLDQLFVRHQFDAVIHFASYIQVGESVIAPQKYYDNNIIKTLMLLERMIYHKINNFIFSSTAAIFGNPQYTPIDENHPKNPINAYGRSKLIIEQILEDYQRAYNLQFMTLRYFNAAGADLDGRFGECHEPETHLIPLLLQATYHQTTPLQIYGDDYNTRDGTCIRDYIHVLDIAHAHLLALEQLTSKNAKSTAYNLGNGEGHSVLEVINTAQKITGRSMPYEINKRREGDAAILIADSTKARNELGWMPKYSDLETIIESAWRWELQHQRLKNE